VPPQQLEQPVTEMLLPLTAIDNYKHYLNKCGEKFGKCVLNKPETMINECLDNENDSKLTSSTEQSWQGGQEFGPKGYDTNNVQQFLTEFHHIHSFVHAGQETHKKEQIDLVMTTLNKNSKKKALASGSNARCTRGMSNQIKLFDSIKLTNDLKYSRDTVSKNLDLDLAITKKIDYKNRILFNPTYSPVQKIPVRYASMMFQFLMDRVFPGFIELKENARFVLGSTSTDQEKSMVNLEKMSFRVQNFLLSVIYSEKPIEICPKRGTPKIRDREDLRFIVEECEIDNAKILIDFERYARGVHDFAILKQMSRSEKIKMRELFFVRNLLMLGEDYLRLFRKPNFSLKTFYLTRTSKSKSKSVKIHQKLNSKRDSGKVLGELEKYHNFPKSLRRQVLKHWYLINDQELLNSPVQNETLGQYTKMIVKRENAIKVYGEQRFSKFSHDNCYEEPAIGQTAIKAYKKYLQAPSTKIAQSYLFGGVGNFFSSNKI
jgi:hypothetical protein